MRPARGTPTEGTARFCFQAAIGIGLLCIGASLLLGFEARQIGAAIFLALTLIDLVAVYYFGRLYLSLRQQRWSHELERPEQALTQLFDRARAEHEHTEAPAGEDVDHA